MLTSSGGRKFINFAVDIMNDLLEIAVNNKKEQVTTSTD